MTSLVGHDYKQASPSDCDSEAGDVDLERHHIGPPRRQPRWLWVAIVFSALVTFFATRAYYTHSAWVERIKVADTYSPLYKDFKPRIEEVVLGGDLWGNKSNIYEQDPTPGSAADEAWEDISASHYMLLSEEELIKMHGSVESAVEWPDHPGKYLVEFHGYHLLHCLDVLRKNAYHTYPRYFKTDPELVSPLHWIHWTHCLEIIRQELMCMPSMKLSRMVWQAGHHEAVPEFRTRRMCMRWDDFHAMATTREVPKEYGIEVMSKAHKPADAIERYTPPEGYEVSTANIEWLKKMKEKGIEFD